MSLFRLTVIFKTCSSVPKKLYVNPNSGVIATIKRLVEIIK